MVKKRARSEPSTSKQRKKQKKSEKNVEESNENRITTPFTNIPIKWEYKRYHLIDHEQKTMLTGYESMNAQLKRVLDTLKKPARNKITKSSCFRYYTRLPPNNTRSGKMLHYVVFREVTPTPNPDTTALWFRIGNQIIRFSRQEYALVSGLRFGEATFNPYKHHAVSEDSVFARLFRSNAKISTAQITEMYVNKRFTYWDGEGPDSVEKEITATEDDYVKVTKMLLALTYPIGYERSRKSIPTWLWVLLEDEDEWEKFSWGSYSYQLLTNSITNVKSDNVPQSGVVSYHILGDTTAFCAWIFEAVPAFGKRNEEIKKPRLLRYSYVTPKGLPEFKEIKKEIQQLLTPTNEELGTHYWKSLSNDPERMPFAFKYEPNHNKKKKITDESLPAETVTSNCNKSANLQIDDETLKKIGQYAGEVAAEKIKVYIEELKQSIVQEIIKDLAGDRRSRVHDVNAADCTDNSEFNDMMHSPEHQNGGDQEAGDQEVNANVEDIDAKSADEEDATDVSEEHASDEEKQRRAEEAATEARTKKKANIEAKESQSKQDAATNTNQQTHTNGSTSNEIADNNEDEEGRDTSTFIEADNTPTEPSTPKEGTTTLEATEKEPDNAERDGNEEDNTLTDSQLAKALDEFMTKQGQEIIAAPVATQEIALQLLEPGKTRPTRIRFPARPCKSPNLQDDQRAGLATYEAFMATKDRYMNVGLIYAVDKYFFKTILSPDEFLEKAAVHTYLSILVSRPDIAGIGATQENIAITTCYFMNQVEEAFEAIHKKKTRPLSLHIKKDVPIEMMNKLLTYAKGEYPCWGDNMKPWIECEKVVTACIIGQNWATVLIDLKKQVIYIYHPRKGDIEDQERQQITELFMPMAKVLPRIMQQIQYDEVHRIKTQRNKEWDITLAPPTGKHAYKQKDEKSSGLYSLKTVERIVARIPGPKGLKNKAELLEYRRHIARTIYAFSIDEPPSPFAMPEI